jgi:type VI secretion system secreted protein VgrG
VSGGRTESTGKDVTLAISGSSSLRVGSNVTESIGSDQSVQVSKTYTISAGDELSITVGAASFVMKSDGTITLNGNDLTLKASGQIGIQAASAVAVKGGTINLN